MKIKKLVSALSALTIAAGAFAGLAVTASAAENIYTSNWNALNGTITADQLTGNWAVANGSQANTALTAESGVITINSGTANNNNGYLGYLTGTTETAADKIYRFDFDYRTTSAEETNTSSGNLYSNIATCNANAVGTYTVFGSDINIRDVEQISDNDTTYDLSVIIDNVNKKAVYQVNGITVSEDALSGVNTGIEFRPGRNKNDYISNFAVSQLTMPTLTVTTESQNVAVGSEIEIDAATNGNISVSSNSTNATASYEDGKIKVTGVNAGLATITVTATGSDPYETTSKSFDVTVGDVETANVIINYYITGTEDSVPEKTNTSETQAVGSQIEESSINKNSVIDSGIRYAYKSITINGNEGVFPYEIESSANVVINVYFDKQEAVNTLHVSYINGNAQEIGSQDISLSDKYVGDTVGYYAVAYVDGTDGKLYKYDSLPNIDVGGNGVGTDWSYRTSVINSVEDGKATVTLSYSEVTGILGYQLYEDDTANADQAQARVSGGRFNNNGSPYTIFTVEESGTYTLTLLTAWRSGWSSSGANGVIAVNGTNIDDVKTFASGESGIKPYKFEYTNLELNEGDVITFITSQARIGVDYALLIKTPVAATATYSQIGTDFTTATGNEDVDSGSAFKLFVTAGTDVITNVGAKVNNVDSQNTIDTVINSGSTVTFAIAVNAAASDIDSIKAVINGTTEVEATKTTAIE